jgi:hypothetical protein
VAVKVSPTWHELPPARLVPEQVSDAIWKFAPGDGPVRVVVVTVPIRIGEPVVFDAVIRRTAVVVPVLPKVEYAN